jgi:hypothetical protein
MLLRIQSFASGATKVYRIRSGDLLAIDRRSLDVMEGEIDSIVGIAARAKQIGRA